MCLVGRRIHLAIGLVVAMKDRYRDTRRAKDYDGLIHERSAYGGTPYACNSVPLADAALHGVWEDEATSCFLCLCKQALQGRWRGV